MYTINASALDYQTLNQKIREASEADSDHSVCEITHALGQRFIAAGLNKQDIIITGTPGNALGAYLNGAKIEVFGNAQDAVGDTMNDGEIIIHGNIGDAAGYAMRGGKIFVRGNAGYRAGIHMKEYKEKKPVMVIGGKCGSFLGEYQAGGILIVLGLEQKNDAPQIADRPIVSNFPCTGMHGGRLYLRGDIKNIRFPAYINTRPATDADMHEINAYLTEFCTEFDYPYSMVMNAPFTVVSPDTQNPYKQMYVTN